MLPANPTIKVNDRTLFKTKYCAMSAENHQIGEIQNYFCGFYKKIANRKEQNHTLASTRLSTFKFSKFCLIWPVILVTGFHTSHRGLALLTSNSERI
jgi:hypothetical protein